MSNSIKIANSNELEFAVFCIENIAIRLGKRLKIFIGLWQKKVIF